MGASVGRSALGHVDLLVSQGADNEYVFRYGERDDVTGAFQPYDLTGWSARAQGRSAANAEPAWFTCASPQTIVLGSDGTIVVYLGRAVTIADAWDTRSMGVWDLELTDPSGKRVRLVEGAVRVSHDVTRDADGS